ncbi:MAG: AAA family ATPase [Candidatus Marinimicrobia bacterium]|nr:AAA family ATPase [Candidatus Neomarinimicrobiota bacterium]MCF7827847.1 AAA family ATPase [Candidatus Neomarinimicrobiota bacterium]MCF7879398.1 AAA family ATPase [Candidatus Neomarinimicrobiota bacterium]
MSTSEIQKLTAEQLTSHISTDQFSFESTIEVESLEDVIGQDRAVRALEFGLNVENKSYNIFVTGMSGTGKATLVKRLLEEKSADEPVPDDWLMVNNFEDSYRPISFPLPFGEGVEFSRKMDQLIENLKNEMPRAFETEDYQEKRSRIMEEFQQKKREKINELEEEAREHDIQIQSTNAGFQTIPMVNDNPIDQETYNNLEDDIRQQVDENIDYVQREIQSTMQDINKLEKEFQEKIKELNKEVTLFVVGHRIDNLKEEYADHEEVGEYLEAVKADIIENVSDFTQAAQGDGGQQQQLMAMLGQQQDGEPDFTKYKVNVLVDNTKTEGAPVIEEINPTYNNIFGRMEKRAKFGAVYSDFTMVQPGSLLRANGGYLILDIEGVLTNPFVWDTLKRSLRNQEVRIEDVQEQLGYVTVSSLKPEPIPLDVKVILIGRREIFDLLLAYDEQFEKTFKVRADFDHETDNEAEAIAQYVQFISRVCREENLCHFSPDGVAALIEISQRAVSDQKKLSLRFGKVVELMTEANYWCNQNGTDLIGRDEVKTAFRERRYRSSMAEEKVRDQVLRDIKMIDTQGVEIGQVNALAVYQIGDFAFGQPSKITAECYMGKDGIINIERNAKLSGKIHDKGVEILSGWLGKQFAQDFPLNINISITFEQSYGGVDGDSASSTEAYAILSSLARVPISQKFAVTGSVNQKGEVQAIGGVNQKIEGFFDICKERGLTGDQGVLIPRANVEHLMLKSEVIDAIESGEFHIYPVEHISQGIEILTGMEAGDADGNGAYPENTIYGKAKTRLEEYVKRSFELRKKYGGNEEG